MMPADIPEHFRGTVNIWATVTSTDGSRQVTFDDSTPVQKQLVDIKYSRDTRKQFKSGLPFKGKVSRKLQWEDCSFSLRGQKRYWFGDIIITWLKVWNVL